jgi:hypothetical protein
MALAAYSEDAAVAAAAAAAAAAAGNSISDPIAMTAGVPGVTIGGIGGIGVNGGIGIGGSTGAVTGTGLGTGAMTLGVAVDNVIRWATTVMLAVEKIQWRPLGYEQHPDGSHDFSRPLYSIPDPRQHLVSIVQE